MSWKTFLVRVDKEQHRKLKKLAMEEEVSMGEIVRQALVIFFKRKERSCRRKSCQEQ